MLLTSSMSDTTWHGSNKLSKGDALQANNLTFNTCGWTFNKDSIMIQNVDNNSKFVLVFAVVDEDETTDFSKFCEYLYKVLVAVLGWMERSQKGKAYHLEKFLMYGD